MTGILAYIAIMMIIAVWIIGWLGISLVAGAAFDLPPKTTALLGALLGPLGLIATLFAGFALRKEAIAKGGKALMGRAANRAKITRDDLMSRRRDESDPFV